MTKFKEITDKRVDDVISIIRTGFPGRYKSSNANIIITANDSNNGDDQSNNIIITANDSNNDSVTNTAINSDFNELYRNISSYSDSDSENTNHLEIDTHSHDTVNHLSHSTEETFIKISEELEPFDNLSNLLNNIHISEPTINNPSILDNSYINNNREVQELELNFPIVYDFKKRSIIQNDSVDSLEKIYCFDFVILSKVDATNLYHNIQECNTKEYFLMFKENILDMITLSTTKKKQAKGIIRYLKKKDNPNKNLNIYLIGSCKKDFEKAMEKIWKFKNK